MTSADLPPQVIAKLDQELAAAQADLDHVIQVYLRGQSGDGEIQAVLDATYLLGTAPVGALIGMIIAAVHRLTATDTPR